MAAIPQDLLDRIRALEYAVRVLTGRAQIRPALNEITNGPVKIGEGGSLEVSAPDGTSIVNVGALWDGAYGVRIQRSDGTLAFNVGGSGEGSNMVRQFSRAGDVILMDDYYSTRFLGRPWIPLQLHPTARQNTDQTTYQTAWWGGGPAINAVARIHLFTYANTGGGQVRVTMTPSGQSPVVVAEYDCAAEKWTERLIERPMHGVEYLQHVTWTIEHRNKSAGQDIETRLYSATGRNTFTEADKPDPPASAAAATEQQALVGSPPPLSESPAATVEPGLRAVDD